MYAAESGGEGFDDGEGGEEGFGQILKAVIPFGGPREGAKMRMLVSFVAGMLLTSGSAMCAAQDFRPYPGSKLDAPDSRQATAAAPGKQSEVYTTTDSFDKVYAFYKAQYKEYTMMGMSPGTKLPSGQQVKWAFFLIDNAKDLQSSRYWMKIQRPYVGGSTGQEIRDITVIQTARGK